MTGFFSDFQHHLPFIHAASFDVSQICRTSPELVLAATAIGAVYRFQKPAAKLLHEAALSLVSAKVHRIAIDTEQDLRSMQALVLLEIYSLWESAIPVSLLKPSLQNVLVACATRCVNSQTGAQDWASWAFHESQVRLVTAAFCVLNVRSIFHRTFPVVAANAVTSSLPSTTALWTSTCADGWARLFVNEPAPLQFHDAYKGLLIGGDDCMTTSSFGCFALLQAILQRIDLSRKLSVDGSLSPADVANIE